MVDNNLIGNLTYNQYLKMKNLKIQLDMSPNYDAP